MSFESLVEVVEVSPKKREKRQAYLRRVIEAVLELPDKAWAELPEEDQDWVEKGTLAIKAGKPIQDPEEEAAEKAPVNKVKKAKKSKKAEPEPEEDEEEEEEDDEEEDDEEEDDEEEEEEEEEEEDDEEEEEEEEEKPKKRGFQSGGTGCYSTALSLACGDLSLSFSDLRKKLEAKGVLNVSSARTAYGIVHKVVALLIDAGVIDGDKVPTVNKAAKSSKAKKAAKPVTKSRARKAKK